ncbi:hypothetical protein DL96DRAFT_1051851 [Flagelloscypha sp. PMI_526]|nr:hypothetical protein DL96DRAFT_1051851 [Flagelloscypha sp. PMI_526]
MHLRRHLNLVLLLTLPSLLELGLQALIQIMVEVLRPTHIALRMPLPKLERAAVLTIIPTLNKTHHRLHHLSLRSYGMQLPLKRVSSDLPRRTQTLDKSPTQAKVTLPNLLTHILYLLRVYPNNQDICRVRKRKQSCTDDSIPLLLVHLDHVHLTTLIHSSDNLRFLYHYLLTYLLLSSFSTSLIQFLVFHLHKDCLLLFFFLRIMTVESIWLL